MLSLLRRRHLCTKSIKFLDATVLKKTSPHLAKIEAAMTQAVHYLSKASGLFYVPSVLAYDAKTGTIKLERIVGFVPLWELLEKLPENTDILYQTGRTLAEIHARLKVPDFLSGQVPFGEGTSDHEVVPMHGDFNTANIGYSKKRGAVIVLDWGGSHLLEFQGRLGSRYFDLADFLRSLLFWQNRRLKAARMFHQWARAFLDGYQAQLTQKLDFVLLRSFVLKVSALRIKRQLHNCSFVSALDNIVYHVMLSRLTSKWRQRRSFCRMQNISHSSSRKV